jgi:UDP-N-acetylmuramate--alanine ligase
MTDSDAPIEPRPEESAPARPAPAEPTPAEPGPAPAPAPTPSRPVGDKPQDAFDRPPDWAAPGAALVRSAATDVVPTLAELGRVHIVGIAGAGMSGLARILLARDVTVSGCEARESDTVNALRMLDARVWIGHSVEHLDDVDTVVYSTAIAPTHLELVAGRERGLRVIRRAAALAAALGDRRALTVAGTHGKTTTTSLLTIALQAGGLDPSFAIGGTLHESGRNAHFGSGEYAIVEADESDGSFLLLASEIAIVTNVEADHLENHGDLAGVERAFEQFVDRIVAGGLLVVCTDDDGSARLAAYARRVIAAGRDLRVLTYGEDAGADVVVTEIVEASDAVTFTVRGLTPLGLTPRGSTPRGATPRGPGPDERTFTVGGLVGRHMALNAAAAVAVAAEVGVDLDRVAASWHAFRGVKRRFELRGVADGVRVYDDYAHHPTEITASLRAARAVAGAGRLVAVFQPGTFSRTQTFATEFAQAMALADIAVVMDIFPSREEPIPGVTGALVADAIPLPAENVIYEPSWTATATRVAEVVRPGDVVVTMGIGDVYLLCPDILAEIALRAGARSAEES